MQGIVGACLCLVGFLLLLTDNPYNAKTKEYGIAWWRIAGIAVFLAGYFFLEWGSQVSNG